MSKKAFQGIAAGLVDAIAFAKGDQARGRARKVRTRAVNVSALRAKLGLSQDEFATAFRVSIGTVRNWEQGRRTPEGPALVLLSVIERTPRTVLQAIWTGPPTRKKAA
jgi:putative transcriptional regulator